MKIHLLLILLAGFLTLTQFVNGQSNHTSDVNLNTTTRANTPWVEFEGLETTYYTNVDNSVTCKIFSDGVIDDICGIGYEIYKDNILIEDISDFGLAYFTVRQEGENYYTGQITEGSGMIEVTVGEETIGAFTLGIFDNYCTNRNRPIEFHAKTFIPGEYKVVYTFYSCSNVGTQTGTTYTAVLCDGLVHDDLIATTCETPTILSSSEFTMNVLEGPTPEFTYSEIETEYPILEDINATASLNSNGIIDQLCGIGYELYKDGVLIENVADYGTLTYSVRQEGETYYEGEITTGSGMIEIDIAEEHIGAFTLGVFDTYCVNRNRPIDFTANLNQPGVYKLVSNLYACSNEGTPTGSSFIASGCDGLEHQDLIAQSCENPILINQQEIEMDVLAPEILFTGLLPEYAVNSDLNVTANVYSNGVIDQLCGVGYEIYKDGVLIENVADYGTLTYSVRQEGETYYEGEITTGSGMIEVTVGEDQVGAFTLGIFDNYCVNRNRPIDFTANFSESGVYEMVSTIYSCSNTGTPTGTNFIATNCDGLSHDDYIGETCETPTAVSQETIEITIIGGISINQQPTSQTICEYDLATLELDAVANNGETLLYQWYHNSEILDGEESASLETNIAGEYYCVLTAGAAELTSETVTITIVEVNPVLEAEIEACEGSSIQLNPGVFTSYLWQDLSTTDQILNITTSGTYSVTVTGDNGCTASASTVVSFVETLTIPWDDSVILCEGTSMTLTAPTADEYLWSNDETTNAIEINEGGWYYLTITQATCTGNDSIFVEVVDAPAEFDLGEDIFTCQASHTISGPEVDAIDYLWSTNEETQSIEVTETGTYTLHIINEHGCETSDEIMVEFGSELVFDIHPNDTIESCEGSTVTIDPEIGVSWLWSTGMGSSTIDVTETDWYYVTITSEFGCEGSDSVYVHFNNLPTINLGNDQEYCADETITLSAPVAVEWLWSTDETTQNITVTETDEYSCMITDANGCQNADTIEITVFPVPAADLGPDATIQANQTLIIGVPEGQFSYEWNTGAETSHILIDGAQLSTGNHNYSITVTNIHGCQSSDAITITVVPVNDIEQNIAGKISITPNPTNGIININGQNINNVSIYDNIGKLLISTKNSSIDLSKYPSGMYFVKIATNENTSTYKVVKQ